MSSISSSSFGYYYSLLEINAFLRSPAFAVNILSSSSYRAD